MYTFSCPNGTNGLIFVYDDCYFGNYRPKIVTRKFLPKCRTNDIDLEVRDLDKRFPRTFSLQSLEDKLNIPLFLHKLQKMEEFQKTQESHKTEEGCKTDWMLVAMVLDRFMLIVFTILTTCVSLGILINHPAYITDPESFVE